MLSSVSFAISMISFFLTALTVIFTYRFNRITIRNTAKQEHQKMLLEVNKMMIADPLLWTIYDDHPLADQIEETPELKAKKEALIYYYLNYFDVVCEFYNKHIIMNKTDKQTWDAWKEYIEYFIGRSSQAREIIKRSYKLYENDLSNFYRSIIEKYEPGKETEESHGKLVV